MSKVDDLIDNFKQDQLTISNDENNFTPLKNSIRSADEFSSKLPVTDLYGAPLRGADSNLHWYKKKENNKKSNKNKTSKKMNQSHLKDRTNKISSRLMVAGKKAKPFSRTRKNKRT
jgi:hypothetical protein